MAKHVIRAAFPRTIWVDGDREDAWNAGANGENGFWRIWAYTNTEAPLGTMAQEHAEWVHAHKVAALLAVPHLAALVIGAVMADAALLALAPLIYLLAYLTVRNGDFFERRREFLGHAISMRVADRFHPIGLAGVPDPSWLERHVRQLQEYPCFKGWDSNDLRGQLVSRIDEADKWVRTHDRLLRSWSDFLNRLANP